MKELIYYDKAIGALVACVSIGVVSDMFAASTILAVMFEAEKEETLDDLLRFKAKCKVTG